jgi:membrane-bound lytic murein transglycosylase A
MKVHMAAAAMLLAAFLSACAVPARAPTPPEAAGGLSLTPVSFQQLPGWSSDRLSEAVAAFVRGCGRILTLAPDTPVGGSGQAAALAGKAGHWHAVCTAARALPLGDDAQARAFFEQNFQAYALTAASTSPALFTGYFEPEVAGSRSPLGPYQTPLLRKPNDLIQADLGAFSPEWKGRLLTGRVASGRFIPYYTRAEIDAGALDSQRLALVWLADPIDAYFVQVQGSARVRLPDGKLARFAYAAQNGWRYVPIGRILESRGALKPDEVSMQTIRAWLKAHPAEARGVMEANPAYVFFRELLDYPPNFGPPGALDIPLTPGRSAAVDRTFVPIGAPLWVATRNPLSGQPWQHLVMAQDLGSAIEGPLRTDLFLGWGKEAEDLAGRMRESGSEFLLLPRQAKVAGL